MELEEDDDDEPNERGRAGRKEEQSRSSMMKKDDQPNQEGILRFLTACLPFRVIPRQDLKELANLALKGL